MILLTLLACFGIDQATYDARLDQDGDGAIAEQLANDGEPIDCDDNDPDNNTVPIWYADADGDGEGAGDPIASCDQDFGTVANDDDCDDSNSSIHSEVTIEACDDVDNDCDGLIDELDPDLQDSARWYSDNDSDGYGLAGSAFVPDCGDRPGMSNTEGDCNDDDDTVHPNAIEQCDGLDNDCDGNIVKEEDGDNDLYRACNDCDDADPLVNPSAPELCNGIDDNCDGGIDENSAIDAPQHFTDADGDGYGVDAEASFHCALPAGFSDAGGDCDDTDGAVNPAATEVWYDDVDQDCDGNDDDQDGDGADALASGGTDCDDTNAGIAPHIAEDWYNGIDENCDGQDDDQDNDGFLLADDCNDTNDTVWLTTARVPSEVASLNTARNQMCGGGTIILEEGDHFFNFVFSKNLTLAGEGTDKTFFYGRMTSSDGKDAAVHSLTLNGAGVTSNSCIYTSNGTLEIRDVVLERCSSSGGDGGGGLRARNTTVDIDGLDLISNNGVGDGGGARFTNSQGVVRNVYGTDNIARRGGGFYVRDSSIAFENIEFEHNQQTVDGGGGLYMHDNDSTIDGLILLNNNVKNGGGGLHLQNFTGTISNFVIRNHNSVQDIGAGIRANIGSFTLENGQLYGNRTARYTAGTAFYGENVDDLIVRDVLMHSNEGSGTGGGAPNNLDGVFSCYKCDDLLMERVVVRDNIWDTADVPEDRRVGIALYDGDRNTVRNSIVADNQGAIGLRSETRYLATHTDLVVENMIFASDRQAIEIVDSPSAVISHVTVVRNGVNGDGFGIELGGATLQDSLITHHKSTWEGLVLTGSTATDIGFYNNDGPNDDGGGTCTNCLDSAPMFTTYSNSSAWDSWDLSLQAGSPFITAASDGSQLGAHGGTPDLPTP